MLQVLKETICDYSMFIREITILVSQRMGEEYSTRILKVTKNNSLELDSLVLLKEGKNFAPNIYLLPYYEAYMEGVSLKELAKRLCDIYYNYTAPITEEKFSYTYEDMKSYIVYRLVNYDKNKKLLENIPHVKYLDLAVTFHCLVHKDEDGIGTIRITNEHMELWNVTLRELKKLAVRNTMKRFPPMIRSMEEVIRQMLSDDAVHGESPQEQQHTLFNIEKDTNEVKMYILSNSQGINGATCLLYQNILKNFSEQIQSDFYVLPSSIHEVILVPNNKMISKDNLEAMVRDVNLTQVACDEVLSDKVYYYSRERNAIIM